MAPYELNVEQAGNPDGPPLALMHGLMSCNSQWDLNLHRLGRHLRLILIELPGHGSSPAPDDPSAYRRPTVLAAIDRVRHRLGLDRWWLGGHSLGAAVAIRFALDNPAAVNGLVITNTRAAFGVGRPVVSGHHHDEVSVAARRRIPVHPANARYYPSDLRLRLEQAADAMAGHALAHTAAARADWLSIDEWALLDVPIRLIWGRYERAFTECVPQARNVLPDLDVVEVEAGHSVNIEQPEAYDRAVLEFVVPGAGSMPR